MRALFTWTVNPASANSQQILVEIGGCLPPGKVRSLTPNAAVIVGSNVDELNTTFLHLEQVINRYAGEVDVVLAGQMEEEILWSYPTPL